MCSPGSASAPASVAVGLPAGAVSIFTRATFNIADVTAIEDVVFGADFDDGIIVWLNGLEVYRSPQMPQGAPDWDLEPLSHESSNGSAPSITRPMPSKSTRNPLFSNRYTASRKVIPITSGTRLANCLLPTQKTVSR